MANEISGDISVFAVNQITGALTVVPGSPFAAGNGPRSVAYSPDGLFLAVANQDSNNVSVFGVEQLPTDALSRAIYLKYVGFCSLLT